MEDNNQQVSIENTNSKRIEYRRMNAFDFDAFYKKQEVTDFLLEKKRNDQEFSKKIFIMRGEIIETSTFVEINRIPKNMARRALRYTGPNIFSFVIMLDEKNWTKCLKDFEVLRKKLLKSKPGRYIPPLELQGKNLEDIFDTLIQFLQNLVVIFVGEENLSNFLEISYIAGGAYTKHYKECFVKKRTGGRYKEKTCRTLINRFLKGWQKRWLVVTEDGIMYAKDPKYQESRSIEMLLFDPSFKIEYGRFHTGSSKGLILITLTRKLHINAMNAWEAMDIVSCIQEAVKDCKYTQTNRFQSFAPQRESNSYCKWYVDGQDYFKDIYEQLNKAQKQVFITDWWLSPEIYLKRPVTDSSNQETRLDRVLGRIAERGVMVNIILYKEVSFVIGLDSKHSKKALQCHHPNIKVKRHPKDFLFLWSHHEKMVIIDQAVAFMGGLDLAFGRMDNKEHKIEDMDSETGKDYHNIRLANYSNVKNFEESSLDRLTQARLPWHDIAMQVRGLPVKDLARHFITYWNFTQLESTIPAKKGVINQGITPVDRKKMRKLLTDSLMHNKQKSLNTKQIDAIKREDRRLLTFLEKKEKDCLMEVQGENESKEYVHNVSQIRKDSSCDNLSVPSEPIEEENRKIFKNKTFSKLVARGKSEGSRKKNSPKVIGLKLDVFSYDEQLRSTKKENPNSVIIRRESRFATSNFKDSTMNSTLISMNKKEKIKDMTNSESIQETGFKRFNNRRNPHDELSTNIWRSAYDRQTLQKQFDLLFEKLKEDKIADEFDENLENLSISKSPSSRIRRSQLFFHEDSMYKSKKSSLSRSSRKPSSHSIVLKSPSIPSEYSNKSRKKRSDQKVSEKSILLLSNASSRAQASGTCSCQVLRSASHWSCGLPKNQIENSIQFAYLQLIEEAKHYIYIENQFFISSTAGSPVKNDIAKALILRINHAYEKKQKFKVVVVIPLIPGFEGDLATASCPLLKVQLFWHYQTICRGEESIYDQLRENIEDPDEYIMFLGLRTHGKLKNGPVTEMVYVHSKLMIVDDKYVLIGSANINDRSLKGNRDSEIAIITEDTKLVKSSMEGEEFEAAEFAYTLRLEIWKEIFGMTESELKDPLSDELWANIRRRAYENTCIYREIFACYPDDNLKKLSDFEAFAKKKDLSKYETLIKKVKGFAVQFPLQFLENQDLKLSYLELEYYAPEYNFT